MKHMRSHSEHTGQHMQGRYARLITVDELQRAVIDSPLEEDFPLIHRPRPPIES